MIEQGNAESATQVSLFREHKTRPGLLLRELAWRWGCGGALLALAGYDGWRIWAASVPTLRASGVFALRQDANVATLLANPMQPLEVVSAAMRLLTPQVVRAVFGLLPLALFCWCMAYGLGRTYVLRSWDAALPRRPMMLAVTEALRVGASLIATASWMGVAELGAGFFSRGVTAGALMLWLVLLSIGAVALVSMTRIRQVLIIGSMLALVRGQPLRPQFRVAQRLVRQPRLWPLRQAVRRVRWAMLALVVILTVVPSPFAWGWPLLLWWAAWSLPPLVVADAWRLGAIFELLRILRVPTTLDAEMAER